MNSTSSERLPRTPDNSFPPHPYETDACERIQRFAKTGCFTLDLRQNSFKGQGAICDIFETASERCELPYSAFMEPVHPDDRSLMEELLSASGNAPHERRIDYRLLMPDGRIKHVTGLFNIRFDDSGQALNASGVLQDITALKTLQYENSMLQQLLMQQSKIAQMGEMIESIVHQWKQPLHQINAILPGLERHFSAGTLDSQRLALKLDEIEMLTTHMGQTVDSFRHFFRSDGPKALFCLADAAADVMRLLKRELERSGVEWELCA
ncbi:MAG: PAS domain-containing protein [Campylobacterales bacterium]